jgi:hypothetical protein
MTNGREQIGEQLLADATRFDWWELWPRVVGSRVSLLQQFEGLSAEQAAWRPPTGESEAAWSALELARHAVAYSRNVLAIIEATARGKTGSKDPPGTLTGETAMSLDQLRPVLVGLSAQVASVIERLPPEPNLTVTVPHAFFGPLNSRAWFLFLSIHDGDHARQLQALRQVPGFPA